MTVHALIVDLFGTLVAKWPNELSVARKRRMAQAAGVEERVFRDAWGKRWLDRELGIVSLERCITEVLGTVGVSPSPEMVRRLCEVWTGPVTDHLKTWRSEAVSALQRLRAAGLQVGLVSNAGPEVPSIFRSGPWSELIDAAVFSCNVGAAKPDRRIYTSVCEALSVSAKNCVYVGDGGDQELQGALEVGMTPVWLRVEAEIAKEGVPEGAAAWAGLVISTFDELDEHVWACN